MTTATTIQIKLASDPAHLSGTRKRIEKFAEMAGLSKKACEEVGLAFNEALANVMRHAYHGATDRPIDVSVQTNPGELIVTIRDWGHQFDPSAVPMPAPGKSSPGGLGIMCMRKMMDEVRYERMDQGMRVTMVKRQGHKS